MTGNKYTITEEERKEYRVWQEKQQEKTTGNYRQMVMEFEANCYLSALRYIYYWFLLPKAEEIAKTNYHPSDCEAKR